MNVSTKEKRKHPDVPVSQDIRKFAIIRVDPEHNQGQTTPKKPKPDTVVRIQLPAQMIANTEVNLTWCIVIENSESESRDITARIPGRFAPFKESIESFAEQAVEHFSELKLPRKKIFSIAKHVMMRYIAPLILKMCERPKEEVEDILTEISESDEDIIEMQSLVQKQLKAVPDLHTKCAFSHTSEVLIFYAGCFIQ